MNIERAFEIVNNKKIYDVYYNNEAVWIQEIQNNVAKIGFIDLSKETNVNVNDLYE